MIKRCQRAKINPIDDAKNICPICGGNLITVSDVTSCDRCDYYYITVSPQQDYSIHCMVCGAKIQSGQLCDKCKETMLSVHKKLEDKNSSNNK